MATRAQPATAVMRLHTPERQPIALHATSLTLMARPILITLAPDSLTGVLIAIQQWHGHRLS